MTMIKRSRFHPEDGTTPMCMLLMLFSLPNFINKLRLHIKYVLSIKIKYVTISDVHVISS